MKQAELKQITTFIESYFVTTIEPDGERMHHIDDTEWRKVKAQLSTLVLINSNQK